MKFADFLIRHRHAFAVLMMVLAGICGVLTVFVPVNKDRTKYLSDDSNMKQGLSIMRSEFPEEEKASIRVMFDDLSQEQAEEILFRLQKIPGVSSVSYDADSEEFHSENHTLFVIYSRFDYQSEEEQTIEETLSRDFSEYQMVFRNNDVQSTQVPLWILLIAVALMTGILLIMCSSWLDPVLFLATIGIAVLINAGTNLVFPFVDDMTVSIGPIIQLVLSMDYSIILMNRYRQEKERHTDKTKAMKAALAGSFSSIASSAFTTAAGLLALLFLSFRLGPELGIVLAKGVLISMVCVFTILPVLILFFDRWLEKTKKRSLHIPMGFFAAFSRKVRYLMPFLFLALLIIFFLLQGQTRISFLDNSEDPIETYFPKENTVVLLYPAAEEEQIESLAEQIERDDRVTDVTGFFNTLGRPYGAAQMSEVLREFQGEMPVSEEMIRMLYLSYQIQYGQNEMTIPQLFDYICEELMEDDRLSMFFPEETKEYIRSQKTVLTDAMDQLKGPEYFRLIITSDYADESPETLTFLANLQDLCSSRLEEYYLIGTSVMVSEMSASFEKEYPMVTLITAIAIYLVVLLAFRNFLLPLLLTLLVQCGVFITVTIIGAYTGSIYYLALLIVQSILMGATIDYGIVFCSFYREIRPTADMQSSLKAAYERSIHTILTSGSILVIVLAAIGFFAPAAMISEVSTTLSIGAIISILLILFVLPGLTACCDRLIQKKRRP